MKAEMCQFDAFAVVDVDGNVIIRRGRGEGPAFFLKRAWAERWLKKPRDWITVEKEVDGEIQVTKEEYLHTEAVAVVQVQVTITTADVPTVTK